MFSTSRKLVLAPQSLNDFDLPHDPPTLLHQDAPSSWNGFPWSCSFFSRFMNLKPPPGARHGF